MGEQAHAIDEILILPVWQACLVDVARLQRLAVDDWLVGIEEDKGHPGPVRRSVVPGVYRAPLYDDIARFQLDLLGIVQDHHHGTGDHDTVVQRLGSVVGRDGPWGKVHGPADGTVLSRECLFLFDRRHFLQVGRERICLPIEMEVDDTVHRPGHLRRYSDPHSTT